MKHLSHNKGFTLIELLVVIAIMALLTGIIMSNLASSKGRARDAKRISDLGNIQLALELYFDRCRQYPATSASNDVSTLIGASCTDQQGITVPFTNYISKIPTPPVGAGQTSYGYAVNTSNTDYVLHAKLEGKSPVWDNSLGSAAPTLFTPSAFDCGNSSQLNYCLGPK